MIGEEIDDTKLNTTASFELIAVFEYLLSTPKLVVAIAGESGSGKTYMSAAVKKAFEQKGKKSLVLHMDDFFYLPPTPNHQKRLLDINHVGTTEVDIDRLNHIIQSFKSKKSTIVVPQVHYYQNFIEQIQLSIEEVDALIIEGTYAFYLDQTDFHLFMSRNYHETRELREERNRGNEINDPFIEQVLEIEHQLISSKREKANAWIDFHHNLKYHAQDS